MQFKPFKDLRRAIRAPARLAAAYRQLFRHFAPAMWLFDPATLRVLEVNEAALAEYGLSRESFLAMPVATLLGGAAFDAAADRPIHVAYQRPNGTSVQFELRPRLMPDTSPPVWVCTVTNTAHRSDTEEKLRAVNEQIILSGLREQSAREGLERANRAKDAFLAVVSHELRTPLHSMMRWIQLLRQGKLNAADSAHALEVIERNTRIQAQNCALARTRYRS